MTSSNVTFNEANRALAQAIRASWVLLLVQGVIMTMLGAMAIIWPQISTLAVEFYAGWIFLFSGLVGLVTMFMVSSAGAFVWSLLTSALSLFVGVLLLSHPAEGAASLTLVLIAFFIVECVFQIAGALRNRDIFPESWGWLLMSGVADLVLAAMMVWAWPLTASWALGLIVGINLVTSGLAIIMVAAANRSMMRRAAF